MSSQWYIAREGKKYGPYPFEQLQQWARSGMLQPTEMVLGEDSTKWTAAQAVVGLFANPVAAVAVATPPPPVSPGTAAAPVSNLFVGILADTRERVFLLAGLASAACLVLLCGGLIALVSHLKKPKDTDQVVRAVEQQANNERPKVAEKLDEPSVKEPPKKQDGAEDKKSKGDTSSTPKDKGAADAGSSPKPLEIAHSKVRGIAFSPNGALLATDSEDGITLWNAKNGEQLRRIEVELPRSTEILYPFGRKGLGNGLVFSEDGKRLFAERSVLEVKGGKQLMPEYVWTLDVESGKTLSTNKITDGRPACLASVNGRFALLPLLTAGGGSVVVYDMENGQRVFQTEADKVPGFDTVDLWTNYCVSQDGKMFFSSGSALGKVGRLMSIDRNQTLRTIEWPEDVTGKHCLFSPDGGSIIVLCDVQKKAHVRVFATANVHMTAEYRLSEKELGVAPQVAVSRNGRWLYVGAGCGETLLDLEKRSSVPVPFSSGKKHRWRPIFTPDSRRLAVVIEDKVVVVPVKGKKE